MNRFGMSRNLYSALYAFKARFPEWREIFFRFPSLQDNLRQIASLNGSAKPTRDVSALIKCSL
jgi:hypothetical protein